MFDWVIDRNDYCLLLVTFIKRKDYKSILEKGAFKKIQYIIKNKHGILLMFILF